MPQIMVQYHNETNALFNMVVSVATATRMDTKKQLHSLEQDHTDDL